ncbi:DUF7227 family protein [Faunimonas sp. B44]|uniref:DUF7227 family protein n=1 Tax=Faunimonas sp. B44 TaxID=3461493 RepID=UPI004043A0B3
MNYHVTLASTNVKTGPIPVITASKKTCPPSCPLYNAACYASLGPLSLHWDKVTRGEKGGSLEDVLTPIRRLRKGEVWRYGQAGDLPGDGENIDKESLLKIAAANRGKHGIVFTHKKPTEENLDAIRAAAAEGLTINLSANSPAEADTLAEHGQPVVTILPSEYGRKKRGKNWEESYEEYRERTKTFLKVTPEGRKVVVCPATTTDLTCKDCALCSRSNRNGVVVGFPAHGTRRGSIDRSLTCRSRGHFEHISGNNQDQFVVLF